jgi:hypothetical protein
MTADRRSRTGGRADSTGPRLSSAPGIGVPVAVVPTPGVQGSGLAVRAVRDGTTNRDHQGQQYGPSGDYLPTTRPTDRPRQIIKALNVCDALQIAEAEKAELAFHQLPRGPIFLEQSGWDFSMISSPRLVALSCWSTRSIFRSPGPCYKTYRKLHASLSLRSAASCERFDS